MIFLAAPAGCTMLPASMARTIRGNLPASHRFISTLAAPAEGDVIETTMTHTRAWAERMNCRRTLLILAREGLHPPPQKAGAMQ